MRTAFSDTSYYVALVNPHDTHHARVTQVSKEFRGRQITTDFVLVELGNYLSRTGDRAVFLKLLEQLKGDPHTLILPATRDLLARGLELFRERPDKDWSLTDCISFVAMQDQQVTEALAADHHFEQAGFITLLK